LAGYQNAAMCGSCTACAPSGVRSQSFSPSMVTCDGIPSYCTTTVMGLPLGRVARGVTTSLEPVLV
jgi:hypothetical protein